MVEIILKKSTLTNNCHTYEDNKMVLSSSLKILYDLQF